MLLYKEFAGRVVDYTIYIIVCSFGATAYIRIFPLQSYVFFLRAQKKNEKKCGRVTHPTDKLVSEAISYRALDRSDWAG